MFVFKYFCIIAMANSLNSRCWTRDFPNFWKTPCTKNQKNKIHKNWSEPYFIRDLKKIMFRDNLKNEIKGIEYGHIFKNCCARGTMKQTRAGYFINGNLQ